MCMVLKTLNLSKNTLVHLLYLILIVATVSNQAVEEPTGPIRVQPDENINIVDIGTDPSSSNVDKGSTINGEDPKPDDEVDPFSTMTLGLAPEEKELEAEDDQNIKDPFSTMTLGLTPEEKELEAEDDQNIKGADPIPSDVEKGSTTDGGLMEQNKNMIKGLLAGLSARNSINQPNKNEINNIDHNENNIDVAGNSIEDQKLVVEDDSTTPGELKPDQKELDIEDGKESSKKKKKKKKSEIISDTQDTPLPPDPINPNDLTQSSLDNIDIQPEENEIEVKNDQNIKGIDPIPSNVIKASTIKGIMDRMNSMKSISQSNKNEINNIELEENNIDIADNDIEDQKLVVEGDSIKELDIEDGKESSKKKKKKKKKKKSEIIPDTQDTPQDTQGTPQDPQGTPQDTQGTPQDTQGTPKDTQDTPHPFKPIDPKDLTLSSLENVEIVKIKPEEVDPAKEAIRKEKKRAQFKEFEPTQGNARIYCTFLGNVLKMFKKVRKRFVGHFCHAIVYGAPIILKNHRVHLSDNMRNHLREIHEHKERSLIIVIMQFSSYKYWVHALRSNRGVRNLIIDIIHTVVQYKIDGIQFSNLHPTRETDEVNTHMMNNLIRFFEKLQVAAKEKNRSDLKIGITIDMHGLSITKSFTSFKNLNSLVTWYSFKTISMVKCSSAYTATGTSPLEGNNGFRATINALIQNINHNNEFDMTKLVVGIQLFPDKKDDPHPSTYEELCSSPKDTWDKWCAARPDDHQAKGRFLRGTQIGGVQLYYMHSDDYRSTCGCYSFPLIRALLRGLIKVETQIPCNIETANNEEP